MKFIASIIYLFLILACSPRDSNNLVLRDSVTGENVDSCSSYDENENRKILPTFRGECDYIQKPF